MVGTQIENIYISLIMAAFSLDALIAVFLIFRYQQIDKYVDNRKPLLKDLLKEQIDLDPDILVKIQEIGKDIESDCLYYFSKFNNSTVAYFVKQIINFRKIRNKVIFRGKILLFWWTILAALYFFSYYSLINPKIFIINSLEINIFLFFFSLFLTYFYVRLSLKSNLLKKKIKCPIKYLESDYIKSIKSKYKDSFKNRQPILEEGSNRTRLYNYRYETVNEMLMRISLEKNLVVDLGCGDGILLKKIRKEGYNYLGVDLSLRSLRFIKNDNKNVSLIQGDIEKLPLKSNSISNLVTIETLEHLLDLSKGLEEINRCIKPHGYLVATVPSALNFRNIKIAGENFFFGGIIKLCRSLFKGFIKHSWKDDNKNIFPHKLFWKWKLKRMIIDNGFKILIIKYTPLVFKSENKEKKERIFNKVTSNRFGELIIVLAKKQYNIY